MFLNYVEFVEINLDLLATYLFNDSFKNLYKCVANNEVLLKS